MESPPKLTCTKCGSHFPDIEMGSQCPDCGGFAEYSFDPDYLKSLRFKGPITFWRYRPVMPPVAKAISLGEGGTPLWRAKRLSESLKLGYLMLKDETRNPTSSFKDRAASLMISDALGKGFDSVVCATSGNHGASLAAYSAMEDISCRLVIPSDLDLGKLAQMIAYDADIEEAGENIEAALTRAAELADATGAYQATTELNSLSVEAMKTISYEIVEQGCKPDWVAVAMGSGATIHALWKGFLELEEMGLISERPRLIGVQAAGCAPIADAFIMGESEPIAIEAGDTVASAIKNSKPMHGSAALRALRESGGFSVTISDDSMLEYGREIARSEGIFAEPASAASVACLPTLVQAGEIGRSDTIVSLITSSGLKTNDILKSLSRRRKSPGLGSRLATKERLLREISRGQTYGYALWKGMEGEMTLGAVYQHLSDLEGRGLVSSHAEGKRRYLTITDKGRRVLGAMDELQVLL